MAGFCPGGVHFDGATYLSIASLAATDNTVASMSAWIYLATDVPAFGDYPVVRNAAPGGYNALDVATGPSYTNNAVTASFGGPAGPDAYVFVSNIPLTPGPTNTPPGAWYHVLVSGDISTLTIKMYINGVDSGIQYTPSGSGGTLAWNGHSLYIGSDNAGSLFVGDMAEVWVAPGQSLLDGSGDIPAATIAKFYDAGCPVNLGADGSLPTGTAPAAYFSRGPTAPAADFATNLGTGGAFTLTGAFTAVDHICACTTPSRPYPITTALIPARVGSGGEGL